MIGFCRAFLAKRRPFEVAGPVEKSRAPSSGDFSSDSDYSQREQIQGYWSMLDFEKTQHRANTGLVFSPRGRAIIQACNSRKHKPYRVEGSEREFTRPVSRHENTSAHGSIEMRERCHSCNRERRVLINGSHREVGPWRPIGLC